MSNVIGQLDLSFIVKNQNFTSQFVFTNSEGNAMDLSTYPQAFFDIIQGEKVILTKGIGTGITITDNTVLVAISQADLKGIATNVLSYEFRFVNATGENFYVLQGALNLINTVGR